MPAWIVRCSNPRCRHVCRESSWVPVKTDNAMVSKLTCPKCGCKSFYKANAKEIERFSGQSARVEAAVAAE